MHTYGQMFSETNKCLADKDPSFKKVAGSLKRDDRSELSKVPSPFLSAFMPQPYEGAMVLPKPEGKGLVSRFDCCS